VSDWEASAEPYCPIPPDEPYPDYNRRDDDDLDEEDHWDAAGHVYGEDLFA
jgi:hypothetical protein